MGKDNLLILQRETDLTTHKLYEIKNINLEMTSDKFNNYKEDLEDYYKTYAKEIGLSIDGIDIFYVNDLEDFGRCHWKYIGNINQFKDYEVTKIELNKDFVYLNYLMENEEEVRDVLRHEMIHALCIEKDQDFKDGDSYFEKNAIKESSKKFF